MFDKYQCSYFSSNLQIGPIFNLRVRDEEEEEGTEGERLGKGDEGQVQDRVRRWLREAPVLILSSVNTSEFSGIMSVFAPNPFVASW